MSSVDAFNEMEFLDDIPGTGEVVTATFSAEVERVVVEMISTANQTLHADDIERMEGRVTDAAGTPASNRGAVLKHEAPVQLDIATTGVKILAPFSTRTCVYGFRRAVL